MTELFLKIVNLSLSASWLVLAVLAARLLLKKAPKWVNVLLWGLVAVRLLCPFTLESAMSLVPSTEVVSPEIIRSPTPVIDTGFETANHAVNPLITDTFSPAPGDSANPLQIWIPILSVLWIVGMAAMAEYTFFTYNRLLRQVRLAIRVNDNVYLSENISSPFVLGIFRPRIYLPYGMTEKDMFHVIAHERTHIQRRDHWWKPLGFLLLSIHWFNPLLWVAYILLCRDIELACDENVVHRLRPSQRADYSQALLNCSVSHRSIAACPVAFGEVGVKQRVKNVLTYRRPAFWVIVIALAACLVVAVCFLTSPVKDDSLDRLQNLSPGDITCIEYRCATAAPDKQYGKFEERVLLAKIVADLNRFDGKKVNDADIQHLLGSRVELTITMKDGTVFLLVNHANRYLQIGEEFYEDTHNILNTWNFSGTSPLPEADPASDSFYGVSLAIEEISPAGATVVFVGEGEKPAGRLLGGNDYWLQTKNDGTWVDITKVPEPSFITENYDIDNIRRHQIDWQWRYGTLPSGHYRIGKYVTYQDGAKPLETDIVWAEFTLGDPAFDAAAILHNLVSDQPRAEATFVSGGGYNCFRDEAESLVQILNSIEASELMVSQAMNPTVSVNVYAGEWVVLHYNGMYVQFDFRDSDITTPWAVDNGRLNEFMEHLLSMSPENSTYEIYNVAPLEDLTEHYSVEEAMIDRVVIIMDGDARYNEAEWWDFLEKTRAGEAATVRLMHYYSPQESVSGFKVIYELIYDGSAYDLNHVENGRHYSERFTHLIYHKESPGPDDDWDMYEYYTLIGKESVNGAILPYDSTYEPTIYANLTYTPKHPEIPYPVSAELRLNGMPIRTSREEAQAQQLWKLMCESVYLGYEPKTYNLGPELVFTGKDGSVSILQLSLDDDLIRYDGKFYDYGPGTSSNGSINNLPVFLGILGLENWPQEVMDAYSDWFREIGGTVLPSGNGLFPTNSGMVFNVWYPDWAYLELGAGQANRLLKALEQEAPNPVKESIPEVPDTVFTIHLAFDGGKEFDLAYMGQTEFFLRDFQTNQVYSFSSEALRQAADTAISETKAILYG